MNGEPDSLPRTGRLLALDVGERRVGVAMCDEGQLLASPLSIFLRSSRPEDLARVARLVEEQRARGVVIGHPLNADGSAGPQAAQVERFQRRLAASLPVPCLLWDEYGSSQEAAHRLAHAPKRRRQAPLDAEAAAVILQDYLDTRAATADSKQ